MQIETAISQSVKAKFCSWDGHGTILDALKLSGDIECYLTGGVVRDTVLGNTSANKDFDLIIGGKNFPKFVQYLSQKGNITRSAFGGIRWHPTVGTAYADLLQVSTFYAGITTCYNVIDVLLNFDFSGNAIAVDLKSDRVLNPAYGIQDLKAGIMKAIRYDFPDIEISPKSKLTYLGANIIRCRYYAEKLKLVIDPITLQWIESYQRFDEMVEDYEVLLGAYSGRCRPRFRCDAAWHSGAMPTCNPLASRSLF